MTVIRHLWGRPCRITNPLAPGFDNNVHDKTKQMMLEPLALSRLLHLNNNLVNLAGELRFRRPVTDAQCDGRLVVEADISGFVC